MYDGTNSKSRRVPIASTTLSCRWCPSICLAACDWMWIKLGFAYVVWFAREPNLTWSLTLTTLGLLSIIRRIHMSASTTRYWLLKAEPDTRVVKGKDVKVWSNFKNHPRSSWSYSFYSLAWRTSKALEHHHGRVSGTMKRETWWRRWKKETRFASDVDAIPISFLNFLF